MDFDALKAPFDTSAISWRAQQVTKDGTSALALAYIDARDVMNRLDDVCGPAGWQCKYSHANGKTVCDIGIRIFTNSSPELDKNGAWKHPTAFEWIWKADGAGDSDIEAEKGALSDAFKRAAVRWGIGRYLYDMEAVWVPCESYKVGDKWKWQKFTKDPWDCIKPKQPRGKSVFESPCKRTDFHKDISDQINNASSSAVVKQIMETYADMLSKLETSPNQDDCSTAVDIKMIARRVYTNFRSMEEQLKERE